jgi:hypothetical protein
MPVLHHIAVMAVTVAWADCMGAVLQCRVGEQVSRYRTEHAAEEAARARSAAAAWILTGGGDPSYLIIACGCFVAWQWRQRQATARLAKAEEAAADARLKAVEDVASMKSLQQAQQQQQQRQQQAVAASSAAAARTLLPV